LGFLVSKETIWEPCFGGKNVIFKTMVDRQSAQAKSNPGTQYQEERRKSLHLRTVGQGPI
jgi:hypothetical protein